MKILKFIVLLMLISFSSATTFQELSLDDMLERTQISFYGKVTAIETIEKHAEPWTKVTFKITTALYGLEDKTEISLLFYGGKLDNKTLTVSLMPSFRVDENVLIMAYKNEYYSPIVGFNQGLWHEQTLGLLAENTKTLSLNENSELALDGEGASTSDILAAFKKAFEAKR